MGRKVIAVACLGLGAALVVGPVSAADYVYLAKAKEGQEVEYERGLGTTWSDAPNSEVKLSPSGQFTPKRIAFVLRVWKFTGQNLDMDLSNVTARYGEEALHVYNAAELKKIIKGRAAWAEFAAGMLTGVRAGLATNASTVRSSGRIGRTYYSSESTIMTPDYQARAEAYADGRELDDQIENARDASIDNIDAYALQRTTLKEDDNEYVWKIVIDRPKKIDGSMLTVSVTVGTEVHEFDFEIKEQ